MNKATTGTMIGLAMLANTVLAGESPCNTEILGAAADPVLSIQYGPKNPDACLAETFETTSRLPGVIHRSLPSIEPVRSTEDITVAELMDLPPQTRDLIASRLPNKNMTTLSCLMSTVGSSDFFRANSLCNSSEGMLPAQTLPFSGF
ncbi:MAG: hypothetical protein KDJ75_07500 [Alphaproteobacteria bacterium]|nr:hypothetical protein [Alphaproteobacteria bacterium]